MGILERLKRRVTGSERGCEPNPRNEGQSDASGTARNRHEPLFTFLGEWDAKRTGLLLFGSRQIIVDGALREGVIEDADLAMVPEIMGVHVRLAGQLRADLYEQHRKTGQQLQFPLISACFGYAFSKGAESAYLWQKSPSGSIDFGYSSDDALAGRCGIEASEEAVALITRGMQRSYNVFCDCQNNFLIDPRLGFSAGGRWLADAIACGFFWASQIGLDHGMQLLGYP